MPEQLIMAMVCEKMGWTLEQYLCQPVWFIKTLLLKMNLDAEYSEELNKHHGSK